MNTPEPKFHVGQIIEDCGYFGGRPAKVCRVYVDYNDPSLFLYVIEDEEKTYWRHIEETRILAE